MDRDFKNRDASGIRASLPISVSERVVLPIGGLASNGLEKMKGVYESISHLH